MRAFQTVLLDLGAKLRLPGKKLGLVIDLDTCVGCHACATSCKEWNTGGYPAPLSDQELCGGSHLSKATEPRCHAGELRDARDGLPVGARTRREAAADYGGTLVVVPIVCSGLLVGSAPVCGIVFGALAVASAALGVLIERWLFFAKAEHVAMLYYGSEICMRARR